MPTYAYECSVCGPLEVEQRITDSALRKCPKCGEEQAFKKLIAPVAVMFKGSGFHVNDYAKPVDKSETPACSGDPGACGACEASSP